MDPKKTKAFVDRVFDESVVPTISDYIRIPNLSPLFDPAWRENGHMDRAVALACGWVEAQGVRGLRLEVIRLEGRTPLVFMEVPGDPSSKDTVLFYGHLDKQPPMLPWGEGLGPFTPVIRDGRLYGRGGADDGYALFASVLALRALQEQGVPHARAVAIIECCEESGSDDLPAYIEALAPRIGTPSLVVCLDSGCGTYDRLWGTTSLRGLVAGTLQVELIHEGVHSGEGSGVVASSFRVLRSLLSRLEDENTGAIKPSLFSIEIPPSRIEQARRTAEVLGRDLEHGMPLHPGVRMMSDDPVELLLNRTLRPMLSITGAAGLPPLETAGNVLRPMTAVKVSLRIPPGIDGESASRALKRLFETEPPYGAKVTFTEERAASGWSAPPLAPWLERAVDAASSAHFGKPACYMGEGGSIPFMHMLGERFPEAQFLITGVLGPGSNAHGPNEFLHLDMTKKLIAAVAHVVKDHHQRELVRR